MPATQSKSVNSLSPGRSKSRTSPGSRTTADDNGYPITNTKFTRNIVIAQHNVNKKPAFVENLTLHEEVDVWLIQEPPSTIPTNLPNFQLIHYPTNLPHLTNLKPLALTVIRSNIKFKLIDYSPYHVHIKLPEPNINLINIYLSPTRPPLNYLGLFQSFLLNRKLILCGDLNAHHTELGDINDKRGTDIFNLIQSSSSTILNDKSIKTYSGVTSPDWSISSNHLLNRCHWSIAEDAINSDHSLIKISISTNTAIPTCPIQFVHFPTFYNKVLPLKPDQITDVSTLPQVISDAAKQSIKHKPETTRVGYWDSSLQDLKNSIQKLRSKLPSLYGPSLLSAKTTLNDLHRKYKQQLKEKRTKDFLNLLKENNLSKIQQKLLKRKKVATPITSLTLNNETVTDQLKINDILINSFFPPRNIEPLSIPQPCPQSPSPLSTREIQLAIKFIKNVTPGYDRLNAHAIKIWFKISPDILTFLFKSLFNQSLFPPSLGLTVIYPIPKTNDIHPDPSQLRPIGVRPILCKTYEYIINFRLKHHLASNGLFPKYQYGFTPGKSCEDLLHDITHLLANSLTATRQCILISVDVKGAFSNITHQSVIASMIRLNFPSQLTTLIAHFLTNCQMTILDDDGNPTTKKQLTYGCPQGSGLSPTVFNLSLDNALIHLFPFLHTLKLDVDIFTYADDISLLFSFDPSVRTSLINSEINATLSKLQTCLSLSGLEISPTKTRALAFTTPIRNDYLTLNVNDLPINLVKNLTLLGFTLDHHLNHSSHVLRKIIECQNTLPKLKNILSINTRIKHQTKLRLIESHLYSKLYYASNIWLNEHISTKVKNKLVSLQASVSKTIHSLPTHTSNYKSIALLNQPPLLSLCRKNANIKKYKYSHPDISLNFDTPNSPILTLPPSSYDNILFGPNILSQQDLLKLTADYFIFTDGSLYPTAKSASSALVILDSSHNVTTQQSWSLPIYASVYQAEYTAINQALKAIDDLPSNTNVIRILSDSQSVLSSLKSLNPKNSSTHQITESLLSLPTHLTVIFHWCKAHADIYGNNLVDKLANETALYPSSPDILPLPAPSNILRLYESHLTISKAQIEYSKHLQPNSLLFQLLPTYNHPNLSLLGHSPSTMKIITESTSHLAKLKKLSLSLTDRCPCSYDDIPIPQTIFHILTECPLFLENKSLRKSWLSLGLPTQPADSPLHHPNFPVFITNNSKLILNLLHDVNKYSRNFFDEFTLQLPHLTNWLIEQRKAETKSDTENVLHDHSYSPMPLKRSTLHMQIKQIEQDHAYIKKPRRF